MPFTTIITTDELAAHLDDPNWAIIDSRFALAATEQGRRAYLTAHIPGAIYAHLDEDLSGPIVPGATGRHPLPAMDDFVATVEGWGIDNQTQVVVYDDNGGMIAGRVWWLLRWLGHDNVALLDGDWRKWQREGRPTVAGAESRAARTFNAQLRPEMEATVDEVMAAMEDDHVTLADARDEGRYRGVDGGMDPVAGHIPGAVSAFFGHNLNEDGSWRTAGELRTRFLDLLGDPDAGELPEELIFYCGSGVSAVHNLVALQIAGLGDARLYPGSWSHWILDPNRPVATGDDA